MLLADVQDAARRRFGAGLQTTAVKIIGGMSAPR